MIQGLLDQVKLEQQNSKRVPVYGLVMHGDSAKNFNFNYKTYEEYCSAASNSSEAGSEGW